MDLSEGCVRVPDRLLIMGFKSPYMDCIPRYVGYKLCHMSFIPTRTLVNMAGSDVDLPRTVGNRFCEPIT